MPTLLSLQPFLAHVILVEGDPIAPPPSSPPLSHLQRHLRENSEVDLGYMRQMRVCLILFIPFLMSPPGPLPLSGVAGEGQTPLVNKL